MFLLCYSKIGVPEEQNRSRAQCPNFGKTKIDPECNIPTLGKPK